MTHGSFFSGILGFDIAAEMAGIKNMFTCEIDKFNRKYINWKSPETYNHDDIKTFPFEKHKGTIDIISGGDPCQPHSLSGNRKGKEDDRYLWPTMLKGIEIIGPRWVINENVIGTISNGVLDEKIHDLEKIGYSCWPFVIPAASIEADHERKRVFLLANSKSERFQTDFSYEGNCNEIFNEVGENNIRWDGLHDLRPVDIFEFEERMDQPIIATSKDGLPYKIHYRFLKASGNLVVPGLAYIFFKLIMEVENKMSYVG